MRAMSVSLPRWFAAVIVVVALVVVLGVLFLFDTAVHSGEVTRNTKLAGHTIGGLGDEDLAARVEGVAARYEQTAVVLRTPDGDVLTDSAALGLSLDADETLEAAREAGRDGSPLTRPITWFGSFFSDHRVEPVFEVDESALENALLELARTEPTPPELVVDRGVLVVMPGRSGQGIDPASVIDRLPAAAAGGEWPLVVEVDYQVIPPPSTEPYDRLKALIDQTTAGGLDVEVNGVVEHVDAATIQTWVVAAGSPDEGGLTWHLDPEEAKQDLERIMVEAGTDGGDATFQVIDGIVEIVAAEGGFVCCDARAGDVVLNALQQRLPEPVPLPLRLARPEEGLAEARSLGINELVAEFTTNHACCEARVHNIHRIADILRGYVILPGEELSINGFVGRRTVEKGFLAAGVIDNGIFKADVGGGISQFATTIFNAAYFAGLDFGEYQSHSIYLSRYPYGREATLSFPRPDLVIRNTTPYGVLVWPTYTDTSITVQLYSTRYAEVEETGQVSTPARSCTRVITHRKRTFPDGRVVDDSVRALYRPDEGLDCAGNPTETTTTTATTIDPGATTVPQPPPTTAPPDAPQPTTPAPTTTTAPEAAPASPSNDPVPGPD